MSVVPVKDTLAKIVLCDYYFGIQLLEWKMLHEYWLLDQGRMSFLCSSPNSGLSTSQAPGLCIPWEAGMVAFQLCRWNDTKFKKDMGHVDIE